MQGFTLAWDTHKSVHRGDYTERYERRKCQGVRFANGRIVLDNGASYETLSDLETDLQALGWHQLTWERTEVLA